MEIPQASKQKESVEMTQEQAKAMFDNGAIFVLLDFPVGAEFGIDNMSWNVGENFRGIKMIPPGIHFVFFSAVSDEGQVAPRSGFFYNFRSAEIVIRKWNKQLEEIEEPSLTEAEVTKFHHNKTEMDRFLGPYPMERYKSWVSLSNQITPDCLELFAPDCGIINSVAQFQSESSTTQSRQAAADAAMDETKDKAQSSTTCPNDGLPNLKSVAGSVVKYSTIPKQKYPPGATPAEISHYNMDSSFAVETLLQERFNNNLSLLLGEIQFAFICFVVGQNYDSFEQWKKLVHLLCTSADLMVKSPETFISLISILHFQVLEIPSDFFVDIVTSNNFLTITLHEFFQNLENEDVNAKLKKRGFSFKKHLTEKFHWDFTTEPDEYAPVVVDL